jgi:uncharacterized membrane protein
MELYATALAVVVILDLLWIHCVGPTAAAMLKEVQGREVKLRFYALVPVYLSLAFLVTLHLHSPLQSFCVGLCVYAIYDFTNLAIFDKYDVTFAVADSLWGGVLFLCASVVTSFLQQPREPRPRALEPAAVPRAQQVLH